MQQYIYMHMYTFIRKDIVCPWMQLSVRSIMIKVQMRINKMTYHTFLLIAFKHAR